MTDPIPLPIRFQIEAVCDRFEAAWRAASHTTQGPHLESFLDQGPLEGRTFLLRELVRLDADYRRQRGQDPTLADYESRFRGDVPILNQALAARSPGVTQPLSATVASDPGVTGPPSAASSFTDHEIPMPPGYTFLGELGHGGMGVVYKARETRLDRLVALKMIRGNSLSDDRARFLGEARAVARLQHPNIVPIYEANEVAGQPYFAMEFLDGGSLAQKVKSDTLPAKEAARLVAILARAMQMAHDQGIIHRDLKPANVLLAANGTPKVTDFGLAKALDTDDGRTQPGVVLGTPSYMSPEQAEPRPDLVGPLSDVYSLGATLYDLLTGRPPFRGSTIHETRQQVLTREPVPVRDLQPGVPRDLDTICLKCLHKDPARRYGSMRALAEDLDRFLEGVPILARPVGSAERFARWANKNRGVALLGSVVALLLLVVAATSTLFAIVYSREKRAAEEARVDAEENYRVARRSLSDLGLKVPRLLETAQAPAPVRQKVLSAAAEVLTELNETTKRTLAGRALQAAQMQMGDLFCDQGELLRGEPRREKYRQGAEQFEKARALAEELRREERVERDKMTGNLALALKRLGDARLETENDRGKSALALYREALALQQQIVDRPESGEIPPGEARQSLANTLAQMGETYRRLGDQVEAAKLTNQALELRRQAARELGTPTARQNLAASLMVVARIHRQRRETEPARGAINEAIEILRPLIKEEEDNFRLRRILIRAREELGDLELTTGQAAEADRHYREALVEGERLFLTDEQLELRRDLSMSHYRVATALLRLGKEPAANQHYQECLRLREEYVKARPTETLGKIRLMIAQARCGHHAEASATATKLEAQAKGNLFFLYQSACAFALAGRAVPPGAQRQDYLSRAIKVLETAVGAGFKDATELENDPDLDALRDEEGFRRLVARLKKAEAK